MHRSMLYGHTRKKKLMLQLKVFDCHFYLNGHLANPRTLILLSIYILRAEVSCSGIKKCTMQTDDKSFLVLVLGPVDLRILCRHGSDYFGDSWAKSCFSSVSDGTKGARDAIMRSNCRIQLTRRSGGLSSRGIWFV